ncbi:MAG: hypothetical protein LBS70_10890 [Candidatus Accumulibacter sp.]|nr:hypothetical protein [Accumulibacter sp.]
MSGKKSLSPLWLGFMLALGLPAGVSAADAGAEAQQIAKDFQEGKIDLQTFQKKMQEIQSKAMQAIQGNLTPAQRQQLEQAQGQAGAGAPGAVPALPAAAPELPAGIGGMNIEQLKQMADEQKRARPAETASPTAAEAPSPGDPIASTRTIAVPGEILALLPAGKTAAKSDTCNVNSMRASISLSIAIDIPVKPPNHGHYEFFIEATAYNPAEPNYAAVAKLKDHPSSPAGQLKTNLDGLRKKRDKAAPDEKVSFVEKTWGGGLDRIGAEDGTDNRNTPVPEHHGEYYGRVGDVYFHIRGSTHQSAGMTGQMADKLAALAAKSLTYAALAGK